MKHAASNLFAKIGINEASFLFILSRGGGGAPPYPWLRGGARCGDGGGWWRSCDLSSPSLALSLLSFPLLLSSLLSLW